MIGLAKRLSANVTSTIASMGPQWLPFADAASAELPLARLLRLSLFQVSVGMCMVLLTGTLNRVMITELGVAASIVAAMVSLPLLFAPLRLLIGVRSDAHKSAFGWRRVPFIWTGTLMMFAGLAIMPFSLIILSGDTHGPILIGQVFAALAFLLVGAGLHTTQTAGLALASDLATEETRPRVVALLYVMLLVGMMLSALVLGAVLQNFNPLKLIQVIQGTAMVAVTLNIVSMWKQEPRDMVRARNAAPDPSIADAWRALRSEKGSNRLLVALALGTAAFSMQDILLEPYGGEILGLSVSATTALTALVAGGSLVGFSIAGWRLGKGTDAYRIAASGALIGIVAFVAIILSGPLDSPSVFRVGTLFVGLGSGLFAVGTMTAAMSHVRDGRSGLVLGAWGAVQATAAGIAVASGGAIRDGLGALATSGALGPALDGPFAGYSAVYHIEIFLLFATLAAIGPLVRPRSQGAGRTNSRLGLNDLPG